AAERDEVGRAGAGADEVDGHGFTHRHWTTGIAGRQAVRPPTGPARSTAMRVRSPPSSARLARRSASVSRVTLLTTRRPPERRAAIAASSTPGSPAPPP